MAKAWHITNWEKTYEVNKQGREYNPEEPKQELRRTELLFVRVPAYGCEITTWYDDLAEASELLNIPGGVAASLGLFIKMLETAARCEGGKRGWCLDRKAIPMTPEVMAKRFKMDAAVVDRCLLALERAEWIEVADCPHANPLPDGATVRPGVSAASHQDNPAKTVNLYPYNKEASRGSLSSRNSAGFRDASERNRNVTEENITEPKRRETAWGCELPVGGALPPLNAEPLDGEEENGGLAEPGPAKTETETEDGGTENAAATAADGPTVNETDTETETGYGAGARLSQGASAHKLSQGPNRLDNESSGRSPPKVQQDIALVLATEEVAGFFPSMLRDDSQGKLDAQLVYERLKAAYEQGGGVLLEKLVRLAEEKHRSRIIKFPIKAWMAEIKKKNLVAL